MIPAAAAPRARTSALDVPAFRSYWILSWISSMGDGMENVIRGYLVLQLVGIAAAPFWLGMMVLAHWIPFTFFSLYGGILADRYDARKIQIASQLLLTSAAVAIAAATLAGVVTVWWLFGVLLVHGFAGAIGVPAQQTFIHAMVRKDKLLSAVSLSSTARQLSQVVGPAIAGFIFIAFGAGWGFLVNALTFIPVLLFLTFVRVPPLHQPEPQPVGVALREGLGFVRRRPLLGALIAIESVGVVFLGHTFSSLLVVFAAERWPGMTLAYAYLLVASGLGAVAGAAYLGYARQPRRTGLLIVVAAMIEMAAILLFAFATDYTAAILLMVVVGLAAVVRQSLTNTTLQLSAPDRIRGRVMGAYSFGTQGFRIANGPLLGGLATLIGVSLAVAGSAAIVLAVLAALTLAVPQLRSADPVAT